MREKIHAAGRGIRKKRIRGKNKLADRAHKETDRQSKQHCKFSKDFAWGNHHLPPTLAGVHWERCISYGIIVTWTVFESLWVLFKSIILFKWYKWFQWLLERKQGWWIKFWRKDVEEVLRLIDSYGWWCFWYASCISLHVLQFSFYELYRHTGNVRTLYFHKTVF